MKPKEKGQKGNSDQQNTRNQKIEQHPLKPGEALPTPQVAPVALHLLQTW
jgi:hypothetical protein